MQNSYLDMPEKSASSSSQRSSSSFRACVTSSSQTDPQVLSGSGSGSGFIPGGMGRGRDRGRTVWDSSSQRDPGGVSMAGGGGGAGSRSSWGSWVSSSSWVSWFSWGSWPSWGSCESGRSHSSCGSEGSGGALQNPVSSLTLLLSSSAAVVLTASYDTSQRGGSQVQFGRWWHIKTHWTWKWYFFSTVKLPGCHENSTISRTQIYCQTSFIGWIETAIAYT